MAQSADHAWSAPRRVLFRFAFAYFALYLLPVYGCASPLDILPWGTERIEAVLFWPLQHLALWVGQHVFHLTGLAATWHPTGSGDTALSWVLALCVFVLAFVAAAVWSALDWKRPHYRTLAAWLRLVLAFTVGLAMLEYGFVKVFPSQFSTPGLNVLTEAYGDSTPMRLLWTFMGYSTGYTALAGLGEVVGGLLLLFRRTRTAGALLSGAILFNVFLLNIFYDVPVKIYSFHLLLLCAWVMAPDLRALFGLFFLREQVQLRTDGVPAAERRQMRMTGYALQAVILVCGLWSMGWQQGWVSRFQAPKHGPLYGVWRVDSALATTTFTPWKRVLITDGAQFAVAQSDGKYQVLDVTEDASSKTYRVKNKVLGEGALHYALAGAPKANHMVLDGKLGKGDVHVELTRTSPDTFVLQTHGFHWVHEMPPNR